MGKTDLIIIGGGAAGLMAGCAAGELGLKAVVLERKHKPGRKLLMCGNARCNLTTNISTERMLQMFGDPVGPFLEPALHAFSPSQLQRWFAAQGLPTVVKSGNKVYPRTECAADVLNLFTDRLRDLGVSLAVSSPVSGIRKKDNGFIVNTTNFSLQADHLLIATGGVSYPKTGSVGDGQTWARELGHTLEPYRAGLAGFEVDPARIKGRIGERHEKVMVDIVVNNRTVGQTRGAFEIEKWGVGGTALTDASRITARQNLDRYELHIQMADGATEIIRPRRTRPLKEAMVTVGGIALDDIDRQTLQSRCCPNLYFAGEVLDIDGPTGGYNLQAAFSTARLAVGAIGEKLGKPPYPVLNKPETKKKKPGRKPHRPPRKRR